jgi:hypothetical protein
MTRLEHHSPAEPTGQPGSINSGRPRIRIIEGRPYVLVERVRQLSEEGFDAAHDDQHTEGELSRAAACYAMGAVETITGREPMTWDDDFLSALWPWDRSWWKSKTARSDLVRAAALILAELERIDRASARTSGVKHE